MSVDEMRRTNRAQKRYYELADGGTPSAANGVVTNLYRSFRNRALRSLPIDQYVAREKALHKAWIGDPAGMRVLDMGCGSGNPLSLWLARRAHDYTAIDLSETQLKPLRARLPQRPRVRVIAGDFLDTDFGPAGFDLIYARSIFHHFRHFDDFLRCLKAQMNPGGIVITHDPLQTWLPARSLRALYRPFQTDRDWEYPFTRASLTTIGRHFDIMAVQGVMRSSKWAMLAGLALPSLG